MMAGSGLRGYVLLFAALYGGYGALSPFLPAFLADRGLSPQQVSTLLAAATLTRLVAGPLAGRLADATGATRGLLVAALGLAAGATLLLGLGRGFGALLAIALAQAVATAPLAPLADVLALAAARGGRAFAYGTVRGAGSAAFIAATVITGYLVARGGPVAGVILGAGGFALAAGLALGVRRAATTPGPEVRGGVRALLANGQFIRLVAAAALVIGAHAMHDALAVIAWRAAGIGADLAGWLWAEAVAAEVAVFLWAGPRLLDRIGPARAIVVAALAGGLRWAVQGLTAGLPALVAIQALHGLTFALLHLACLALIERCVPAGLRASALTLYGSVGLGLASALVTLAAGPLYAAFGLRAFLAMSVLSLAALPLARGLRGAPRAAPGRADSTPRQYKCRTNGLISARPCPTSPMS